MANYTRIPETREQRFARLQRQGSLPTMSVPGINTENTLQGLSSAPSASTQLSKGKGLQGKAGAIGAASGLLSTGIRAFGNKKKVSQPGKETLQDTEVDATFDKIDSTIQTIGMDPKVIAATGGISAAVSGASMLGNAIRDAGPTDEFGVGGESGEGKATRAVGNLLDITSGFKIAANKDETTGRRILGALTGGVGTSISSALGGGKRARRKQREELRKKRRDFASKANTTNIKAQANLQYTADQYQSYREGGILNTDNNTLYLNAQLIRLKVSFPTLVKTEKVFDLPLRFKKGGMLQNKISEGVSHGRKNNVTQEEFKHLTKKGVAVISREGDKVIQHAEIESNELILCKEVTDKLHELRNYTDTEGAIKLGKWFKKQILENTEDNKKKLLEKI